MKQSSIPLWTSETARRVVHRVAWISACALIATLVVAVYGWKWKCLELIVGLASFWAVLPPVYFWYEYHFIYRRYETNLDTFERFKYGQQLSVAIWAGLALTLGALASSDHFKAPAAPTPVKDRKAQ
jgi:hypothetical protein